MSELKAYILFPGAAKNPLYAGWLEQLSLPFEIVKHYDQAWMPPTDAGIVITHNHYRWEELSILRNIYENSSVPLLILVDGILEYRNSFQHPDLAEGAMFQPLIGHKLACIGQSQIRLVESWGNVGKCELVGLPRLDHLVDDSPATAKPSEQPGEFRLLVATARTPWFNESQRQVTIEAVQTVKSFLDATETINGRTVHVQYRMAEELHLNLQVDGYENRPPPIDQVLQKVDAVITTPSTLQLEAAAFGLPVAILDFHHHPQLTPMAWRIANSADVRPVCHELANPPGPKMLVQNCFLQDALQGSEPAAPRMAKLIETMVQCGQSKQPLPDRILGHPNAGFAMPEPSGSRDKLFPNNPVFQESSLEHLRTELAAAKLEMKQYPEKYFQQRSANQRLRNFIHWLRLLVRNRAATINDLKSELHDLQNQIEQYSKQDHD